MTPRAQLTPSVTGVRWLAADEEAPPPPPPPPQPEALSSSTSSLAKFCGACVVRTNTDDDTIPLPEFKARFVEHCHFTGVDVMAVTDENLHDVGLEVDHSATINVLAGMHVADDSREEDDVVDVTDDADTIVDDVDTSDDDDDDDNDDDDDGTTNDAGGGHDSDSDSDVHHTKTRGATTSGRTIRQPTLLQQLPLESALVASWLAAVLFPPVPLIVLLLWVKDLTALTAAGDAHAEQVRSLPGFIASLQLNPDTSSSEPTWVQLFAWFVTVHLLLFCTSSLVVLFLHIIEAPSRHLLSPYQPRFKGGCNSIGRDLTVFEAVQALEHAEAQAAQSAVDVHTAPPVPVTYFRLEDTSGMVVPVVPPPPPPNTLRNRVLKSLRRRWRQLLRLLHLPAARSKEITGISVQSAKELQAPEAVGFLLRATFHRPIIIERRRPASVRCGLAALYAVYATHAVTIAMIVVRFVCKRWAASAAVSNCGTLAVCVYVCVCLCVCVSVCLCVCVSQVVMFGYILSAALWLLLVRARGFALRPLCSVRYLPPTPPCSQGTMLNPSKLIPYTMAAVAFVAIVASRLKKLVGARASAQKLVQREVKTLIASVVKSCPIGPGGTGDDNDTPEDGQPADGDGDGDADDAVGAMGRLSLPSADGVARMISSRCGIPEPVCVFCAPVSVSLSVSAPVPCICVCVLMIRVQFFQKLSP